MQLTDLIILWHLLYYWKARMEVFYLSIEHYVLNNVEFGLCESTIKMEDQVVTKPRNKWNANDKKIYSINAKAMNELLYLSHYWRN